MNFLVGSFGVGAVIGVKISKQTAWMLTVKMDIKMVIMATFVILLSIAEEKDNKKPREWYRNWALSQDNPYVQNRIKEEGKYNFCLPIL